jgi:ribosomal protein S18 acetylase RimI-like enzyme
MAPLNVAIATEVTPALCAALDHLIPQLSSSTPSVPHEVVSAIIASDVTDLLVATDGDRIVGTLTLATFIIPTGIRSWIEDVVVDERARGLGAGKALVAFAIERARERGASTVDLTSRPSRVAANALYVAMGFALRETNVYRFSLGG